MSTLLQKVLSIVLFSCILCQCKAQCIPETYVGYTKELQCSNVPNNVLRVRWAKGNTATWIVQYTLGTGLVSYAPDYDNVNGTAKYILNSTVFSLTINSLDVSDADTYFCISQTAGGDTTENILVPDICEIPATLSISCNSGNQDVDQNDVVSINVNTESVADACEGVPCVTWEKEGDILITCDNATEDNGGCSYSAATVDIGTFTYTAVANLGGVTESCSVTVTVQDVGECESDPCLHGGTCEIVIPGYRCNCPVLYIGITCETECDCCDFGRGLYFGPGVIWPICQMIALVIVCLVITGVWTCCMCACCRCSHRSRKLQCQIQTGISIVCCLVAAAVTIACGVCYGINKGQPEDCNCDGSPVVTVIVPPIVTIIYIIVIIAVIALVPSRIKGDDGEGCGSSSNARADNMRNSDAERVVSPKNNNRQ